VAEIKSPQEFMAFHNLQRAEQESASVEAAVLQSVANLVDFMEADSYAAAAEAAMKGAA
jgi:hypothetical protein